MLIAFSGLKGSGKDTAASVLIKEYGFTKIAFADALREALLVLDPLIEQAFQSTYHASYGGTPIISYVATPLSEVIADYGWDKAKNTFPEVRRLMQVFGTEVGRMLFGENVWVESLAKRFPDIASDSSRYVITDCRFTNEAKFVWDKLGTIYWINRPGLTSDGHASESQEVKELADYILTNDETIEELEEDIRFMCHMRGIEPIERSGEASSSVN